MLRDSPLWVGSGPSRSLQPANLDAQDEGTGYRFTLGGKADDWVYLPGTVGVQTGQKGYM